MKTVHLWLYLALFSLELEIYHTKVLEEIKAQFLDAIKFSENRFVYENVENYGRAGQTTNGNIKRRMGFSGWITKGTKTPLEYIILIAFPLQQWLRERASMLRYTYIVCRV